ncbi:GH3 auxin-responsive promoter family protein [Pleurocapsa sp. PCC 7319]|uniref:GH3 auxin-responsive promoter family protein n=1 Tax=Pleurocapsa sp. PCC 7319 TaxID=118161 RepID=UPI0003477A0D|nr:GH3 auxin-responsive promoter family protein [Pleurocapsa sp. PCC 7319]
MYKSSIEQNKVSPYTTSFLSKNKNYLDLQRKICANPEQTFFNTFVDILAQSRSTLFGKDHKLSSCRNINDFRRAVPIRQYTDFEHYINQIIDGYNGVLTESAPLAFYQTSGTSGKAKYIPVTRHWREKYRGPALYAQWGLYFEGLKNVTISRNSVLDLSWKRCQARLYAGAIPRYSITQRPASLGNSDWMPPWYDEEWFVSDNDEKFKEVAKQKYLLNLSDSDVKIIVSVNPSRLTALAEVLADNTEWIISKLYERPSTRSKAKLLNNIVQSTQHPLRPNNLWPNLSLISCWNSASARFYQPWLQELYPEVNLIPFSTTSTEGIVTIPVDYHSSAGPLAVNQGIHEFIEVKDMSDSSAVCPSSETLLYKELEMGKTYRLVMSQANGLCRLDMADAYKVIGWVGKSPRLEFVGRVGFHSSFTGEKLSEDNIYSAVTTAFQRTLNTETIILPMFTCVPVWDRPPGYTLAVEWSDSYKDYSIEKFSFLVEKAMQEINCEYAHKRHTCRLRKIKVLPIKEKSFNKIADELSRQGTSISQVKHHWLQKDGNILSLVQQLDLGLGW